MTEEILTINDFGFSTTTEELIKRENETTLSEMHEKVEKLQQRLTVMKNLIWPLLTQLRKDPENDIIRWPNRTSTINTLMKALEAQVTG